MPRTKQTSRSPISPRQARFTLEELRESLQAVFAEEVPHLSVRTWRGAAAFIWQLAEAREKAASNLRVADRVIRQFKTSRPPEEIKLLDQCLAFLRRRGNPPGGLEEFKKVLEGKAELEESEQEEEEETPSKVEKRKLDNKRKRDKKKEKEKEKKRQKTEGHLDKDLGGGEDKGPGGGPSSGAAQAIAVA